MTDTTLGVFNRAKDRASYSLVFPVSSCLTCVLTVFVRKHGEAAILSLVVLEVLDTAGGMEC